MDSDTTGPATPREAPVKLAQAQLTLPPYPAGPASLMAAQTFYNAARQEITERCKFRDQVIITVIGATAAFIGFTDPARIGTTFDAKRGFPSAMEGGLSLLIAVVILGVMSVFLARYLGYQNLKIAELGYYITSAPAYHFQLYAGHQFDAELIMPDGMRQRPGLAQLPALVPKLRQSLAHWDRWARSVEQTKPDESEKRENAQAKKAQDKVIAARNLFALDEVVGFLIMAFSCLGLGLVTVVGLRVFEARQTSPIAATGIGFWIWVVSCTVAMTIPFCTRWLLKEGAALKRFYAAARDNHHDPAAPTKA